MSGLEYVEKWAAGEDLDRVFSGNALRLRREDVLFYASDEMLQLLERKENPRSTKTNHPAVLPESIIPP